MLTPGRHADGALRPGPGLGVVLTGGVGPVDRWPDAIPELARLEAAGASAIWLADHLFWGEPMPEALVMSSLAVAATLRCMVGTGVLQLPLRRAAAVAKAAATLQVVSGGRFALGVGAGEHPAEFDLVGASFTTRGRDLDTGIEALRRAWEPSDDRFAQRPVPPPIPVWVGGRSDAALDRAARLADGWMPLFLPPEQLETAMGRLDERLEALGRPVDAVARGVVIFVSVTGPGWSRDDALGWAGRLWRLDPARLAPYVLTGSAHECADALVAYRAAGADHLIVFPITDHPVSMFEALHPPYLAVAPATSGVGARPVEATPHA